MRTFSAVARPAPPRPGLGIASIYGFVRQANGHIVVETTPGVGTRFDIHLPRASGEPVPDPPRPVEPRGPARGARILVVEDDDRVRTLVARVLAEEGYDVAEAATRARRLLDSSRIQFLPKPFLPDDLLAAVRRQLQR